jgi:hypothetical protein
MVDWVVECGFGTENAAKFDRKERGREVIHRLIETCACDKVGERMRERSKREVVNS